MTDLLDTEAFKDLETLKVLGAGRLAPKDVVRLYDLAFAQYGAQALWNWRQMEQPTITQALGIAESLRVEGDRAGRALAIEIESACRAAL